MFLLNSNHLVAGKMVHQHCQPSLTEASASLLLHTETADGAVVPVWEDVHPDDVVVLKDIMSASEHTQGLSLQYTRIPITAEKPPDYSDLKALIEVVLRTSPDTPIVVNCQLGRGRSTLATVCNCVAQGPLCFF